MRLILFFLVLTACDQSPLGKTNFQACNHAPDSKTGLPVNCQVSLPSTQGLSAWLDAHDSGTVVLENQTTVNSWIDKSGSGINMVFLSGNKALINKKSINDRNSIFFESLGAYNISSGTVGVNAGSDFTIGVSFKTGQTLNQNSFGIDNNSGFSFRINSEKKLEYSIATLNNQATDITVTPNTLFNIVLSYTASSQTLEIQDAGNDFYFTKSSIPGAPSWTDLQISGLDTNLNELVIYDILVDTKDLQTYLNNRWGF